MLSDGMVAFWFKYVNRAASVKDAEGRIRQVELDLVGRESGKVVLVGECKFRNQRFDLGELEKLKAKVDLLPVRAPLVALFSLGGFTREVMNEDVLAVSIDDMYR